MPLYDPVSHLAHAIEAADVLTATMVDGRIVVAGGALAIDIGSLRGGPS